MDRLEIAVSLMSGDSEMLIEVAFDVADKILAHHEATKEKLEQGLTQTREELALRMKNKDNPQAIRVINMMKDALTAEEFANWVGNELVDFWDYESASSCLSGSFAWGAKEQGYDYWYNINRRLEEQEQAEGDT